MITAFTAYKDSAGKLYTSMEAVQDAERRAMYLDILTKARTKNPELVKLDGALVVDLLMAYGPMIGTVAADRLAPQGIGPGGAKDYRPTIAEQEARAREILRPVGKAPELAMPYGGDQPVMHERGFTASLEKLTPETPAKNQTPIQNQTAEKTAGSEKVWPRHPLDPAVSRAEGMEPKLDEAELDQMIEQGMRQAGGVSGRGN